MTGGSQKLQRHVQYGIDLEVGKGEPMTLEILKLMMRILLLLMKGGVLLLINMLCMTIHVPTCIYMHICLVKSHIVIVHELPTK